LVHNFEFEVIMPRRTAEKKAPERGKEIRFTRGTYKGCVGWLDKANKAKRKSKMIYVIVEDQDYGEEVHTRVWRSSYRERHKVPTTWAEAAVQQHPEIEDAVFETARLFASCRISGDENEKTVMDFIATEIRKAIDDNEALPKQTVRIVLFN
jgi:hypothetical protein